MALADDAHIPVSENPFNTLLGNLISPLPWEETSAGKWGVEMLRLALLLLVGMSFFEGAQAGFLDDLRAKVEVQRLATIKAGKIPPVRLNVKQMETLQKETGTRLSHIVWVGAGRQKDGKIFVCNVSSGKDLFGKIFFNLATGTFEADGSYQQSWARINSKAAVLHECYTHGFDPPVKIKRSVF